MNKLETLRNEFIKKSINELDNIFIEGLKRKGFDFKHKLELKTFIKNRCRVEDYVHENRKIFFVDDIPFLMYKYNKEPKINIPINNERNVTMSCDLGEYLYL